MTAPSYTEDLTDIATGDEGSGWVEFGSPFDGQGAPQYSDNEYPYIQGLYAVTQVCNKNSTIGSLGYDYGSTISLPTDGAFFVWQNFSSPFVLDDYAGTASTSYAGMMVCVGDNTSNFDFWDVGGSDKFPMPYGGWQCHVVNTTVSSDGSVGTKTIDRYCGAAVYVTSGPSKGEPHQVDVMRFGRGSAIFEYGEATAGYCNIADFAKANDANDISFTADTTNGSPNLTNISAIQIAKLYPGAPVSGTGIPASTFISYVSGASTAVMTQNATATNTGVSITSQPYNVWGLIQKFPGGYLWQGRIQLGSASNAVDFRDSNVTIFLKWTPKVTTNFNTIEVLNASSRVDMTGFQFICLDPSTTASRGRWITTNDADINLDACTFLDMATFTFDSNTVATDCVWRRCGQIDPGGGDVSGAFVDESAVTGGGSAGGGALLWNDSGDPNTKIDGSTFTKGAGSHHAIEFGTSAPTTMNLTNMTFSGFSASNQQTTSVLYFPDKGSDQTWTVAHTGTTGTISYYKARGTDTVNISSSVVVTITVKDKDGNLLDNVQTAVYKTSDRTQIMNEDTVSGVATENYTGSTPVEVEVRCRKASSGATKYINYSSTQTISPSGLSLNVTMVEDPNNNATS